MSLICAGSGGGGEFPGLDIMYNLGGIYPIVLAQSARRRNYSENAIFALFAMCKAWGYITADGGGYEKLYRVEVK